MLLGLQDPKRQIHSKQITPPSLISSMEGTVLVVLLLNGGRHIPMLREQEPVNFGEGEVARWWQWSAIRLHGE